MTFIKVTITVNRDPEDVFSFLIDPYNTPQWQTSVIETVSVSDSPVDVGTRISEIRRFLGRRFETTFEITELNQDKRSTVETRSGPVRGVASYEVERVPTGTRVTISMEIDTAGFFKITEPVFAHLARRELGANLEALKAILESAES